MNKVLYITNIPTPYRQKRFNTMSKIFPLYGLDLEVIYMAKSEPNRNWIVDKIPLITITKYFLEFIPQLEIYLLILILVFC